MTTIPGTWDLALKTPIGTLKVEYRFEQTADGLRGTATSTAETVRLENITIGPTAASTSPGSSESPSQCG